MKTEIVFQSEIQIGEKNLNVRMEIEILIEKDEYQSHAFNLEIEDDKRNFISNSNWREVKDPYLADIIIDELRSKIRKEVENFISEYNNRRE